MASATMSDELWASNNANPRNWPSWKKWYHVFSISYMCFLANLISASYIPGRECVQQAFGISTFASLLPVAATTFGFCFGPMLSAPASETIGRSSVYWASNVSTTLLLAISMWTSHFSVLTVVRFLVGLCVSPIISVGNGGTIADLFPPRRRPFPSGMFTYLGFVGVPLGFLTSSCIFYKSHNWRITALIPLIYSSVAILLLLGMRETHRPTIFKDKACSGFKQRCSRTITLLRGLSMIEALRRPYHMLLTEPAIAAIALYTSFGQAMVYTLMAATPVIFSTIYDFSIRSVGLVWLTAVVGYFIGTLASIYIQRHSFTHLDKTNRLEATSIAAWTLRPAMVGGVVAPLALFGVAWLSTTSIHWALPACAIAVFSAATVLCLVSGLTYVAQLYGPRFGASALAGARTLNFYLGIAFTLCTLPLLQTLSIHWALSLFAFLGLIVLPVPFILNYVGVERVLRSSAYVDAMS